MNPIYPYTPGEWLAMDSSRSQFREVYDPEGVAYVCKQYPNTRFNKMYTDLFATLPTHPSVLTPRLIRYTRSTIYCVMDCKRSDLFERIRTLQPEQRVSILRDILHGLHHLHAHHIVHGDLKPENILVDENYCAQLIDFENSHVPGTRASPIVSPGYISPECARHEPYQYASDIWSFGIIVFVLYYNFNPYNPRCNLSLEEIERQILRHPFQPIVHKSCGHWFPHLVEPDAMDLITRCLCFSPESRWTTHQLLEHPIFKRTD